jgi:hypothetical protein
VTISIGNGNAFNPTTIVIASRGGQKGVDNSFIDFNKSTQTGSLGLTRQIIDLHVCRVVCVVRYTCGMGPLMDHVMHIHLSECIVALKV